MPGLKLSLGQSSLEKIIDDGNIFVDNTARLIPAFLNASEISVCYFPRRFGKTLNSGKKGVLDLFFNIRHAEKAHKIFANLKIASLEDGHYIKAYANKFPVVNFSFNEVSAQSYQNFIDSFRLRIAMTYAEYENVLSDSQLLKDWQKQQIAKTLNPHNQLSHAELQQSLLFLLQCLFIHYNQKVIVLIDEYDAPLQKSYLQALNTSSSGQAVEADTNPNNDYQQIVEFMKGWLQYGMKDKEEVYKGFVTGVLEVARETLFSGFNNTTAYGMGDDQYAGCFGFLETDVKALIDKMDWLEPNVREHHFHTVQEWYNGYMVGVNRHQTILNPWSVLHYLSKIPALPKAYWLNVADTGLIKTLLTRVDNAFKQSFLELLSGNSIETPIQENMTFEHLTRDQTAIWGLFLQIGYLKVEDIRLGSPYNTYTVRIPNREVRAAYHASFLNWLEPARDVQGYLQLMHAIETGNTQVMQDKINTYLITTTSYFDFENADEARYHCFMLGLFIGLEGEYEIRSNRESGHGRFDVALFPRNPAAHRKAGILLEFKHTLEESKQRSLTQAALQQIDQREYKTEFQDRGIHELIIIGACFHKKSVTLAQKRIALQGSATAQMVTTLYPTKSASLKRKQPDTEMAPSPAPKQTQLSVNLLSATLHGEKIQLERHATGGGGQCGFYALPLANDRASAQQLLLEHAQDIRIRELVAPEIRAAIIENTLPAPLKEKWSDWRDAYFHLSDSFHQLLARVQGLHRLMPQNLNPNDIIQYLRQHPNPFQGNILQQFETVTQQVNQHELHLRQALVETSEDFIEFVNHYIGATGHLSFMPQQTSSLDAIAAIEQWRIYIWQPDASGENAAIVHTIGPEAGMPHHLLHIPGVDTHFELLTVKNTPSLSPSF